MNRNVVEIRGALLFDSWFEDVPLVRDAAPDDRHLIYEGGGVILDLLVRQADGNACLHVGGQVMPDTEENENVADLPVVIQNGRQETHTRTNPIGEFMFHSAGKDPFDLTIQFREKRFVVRGLSTSDPRQWQLAYANGS